MERLPEVRERDAALAGWRVEVRRFAHRLTGDPDLAEDAAQEAVVRFVESGAAEALDSPRAWLHRVALNVVRDHARRRARADRFGDPMPRNSPPTPGDELERRETIREVRRVLDRLSERDRELLLLRESGFRYAEIAEAIGVQASSVATLARRALERFERAYRSETGDDTPP